MNSISNFFKSLLLVSIIVLAIVALEYPASNQNSPLDSSEQIQSVYEVNNNAVFYKNSKIIEADSDSFIELINEWAKDQESVYRRGKIMKGLNPDKTNVFQGGWVVDDNYGWWFNSDYTGQFKELGVIDEDTFEVIASGAYAKDKNKVYLFGEEILGADPESFQIVMLSEEEWNASSYPVSPSWYSYDKNNVFYRLSFLSSDPSNFKYLGSGYSRDNDYYYFGSYNNLSKLEPVFDDSKFTVIRDGYAAGRLKVYKDGVQVRLPLDPESFSVVSRNVIKDINNAYLYDYQIGYKVLEDADAGTLEEVGVCKCVEKSCGKYFKDKNSIFLGYKIDKSEVIDVETFNYLGLYSSDSGMPYSFSYSKDKNYAYAGCGEVITDVDVETFEYVGNGFAKDKNNVYFELNIVNEADPENCNINNLSDCKGNTSKD